MIPWDSILYRLRSHHGSMVAVAREAGACPVALNKIARSEVTQPKFDTGVRLLDMHYDLDSEEHGKLLSRIALQ